MEEFLKLKWRIQEPSELDYGPDFIPEEEIFNSYIYKTLKITNPTKVEDEDSKNPPNVENKLNSRHKFKLKTQIKSFLNTQEHSKCLNALHILQTGKKGLNYYDKGCMELYNNVQQKILEENKKFVEFAKKNFFNQSVKAGFTKPMQNYADLILKKKLERCKDYPQYYKQFDTILYTYMEEDNPIEMIHLANLLELGSLAKFSRPTLLTPYHISSNLFPNTFEKYYSNLSVSQDINVKKLLESHEAEVVISSSGLKKLLNFTDINSGWDIPVVVEEINLIQANGVITKRNVVFIDKPLPNTKLTEVNVIERNLKIGLKSNFCTMEALKYSNSEEPLSVENEDINFTKKKNQTSEENTFSEIPRKLYHNVSYRMWHLRQENEESTLMKTRYKTKDVKVLVRCKLDACEAIENNILQPLSLHVKLEHQPEFGASIPTKTHLINQWASLYFRPFSQICRFRIVCKSKEVLMLENCNIQSIKNELLTHYNYKPSLSLGVLYKIFLELKSLTPGNYLLQHLPKHPTISLLQASNEGSYDLHKLYDVENWSVTKKFEEWSPIDCSLILPKHHAAGEMPGLFPPAPIQKGKKRLATGSNKKNLKKKKVNKKAKETKNNKTVQKPAISE